MYIYIQMDYKIFYQLETKNSKNVLLVFIYTSLAYKLA